MKNKIVSKRKEIFSNKKIDKTELIRICLNKSKDKIIIDKEQNIKNRGAYLLLTNLNYEYLKKRKLIQKAFKINISDEMINDFIKEVEKIYE